MTPSERERTDQSVMNKSHVRRRVAKGQRFAGQQDVNQVAQAV